MEDWSLELCLWRFGIGDLRVEKGDELWVKIGFVWALIRVLVSLKENWWKYWNNFEVVVFLVNCFWVLGRKHEFMRRRINKRQKEGSSTGPEHGACPWGVPFSSFRTRVTFTGRAREKTVCMGLQHGACPWGVPFSSFRTRGVLLNTDRVVRLACTGLRRV